MLGLGAVYWKENNFQNTNLKKESKISPLEKELS